VHSPLDYSLGCRHPSPEDCLDGHYSVRSSSARRRAGAKGLRRGGLAIGLTADAAKKLVAFRILQRRRAKPARSPAFCFASSKARRGLPEQCGVLLGSAPDDSRGPIAAPIAHHFLLGPRAAEGSGRQAHRAFATTTRRPQPGGGGRMGAEEKNAGTNRPLVVGTWDPRFWSPRSDDASSIPASIMNWPTSTCPISVHP